MLTRHRLCRSSRWNQTIQLFEDARRRNRRPLRRGERTPPLFLKGVKPSLRSFALGSGHILNVSPEGVNLVLRKGNSSPSIPTKWFRSRFSPLKAPKTYWSFHTGTPTGRAIQSHLLWPAEPGQILCSLVLCFFKVA